MLDDGMDVLFPFTWPERKPAVPRKQRRWLRRREVREARRRRRKEKRRT